ncbi:type II secretion system GspH family protein [Luteimonas sp. XNQY3]|nr:type II secretion system protein [Luteimonas sp. XNQY3]MCD9004673.1 type II secretion system GspH family protein [Luteimonas sp. XNQY3]
MRTCSESPRHDRAHRQRGDILLESLIAVLIAAIVGGGMAWLASRILDNQREARLSHLAVEALRNALLDQGVGVCGTAVTLALPGGLSPPAEVTCDDDDAIALTLAGHSHAIAPPPRITLEIGPADLGLDDTGPPLTLGSQQ